TRAAADAALRDLRAAGFKEDQIGLVARNASGKLENESGETYAEEGGVQEHVCGAGAGAGGAADVARGSDAPRGVAAQRVAVAGPHRDAADAGGPLRVLQAPLAPRAVRDARPLG